MIFNHPRQTSTHPFFPLLEASVPECFWQRSGHRVQQGHIMKPCPTVSPRVLFFVHLLVFLVEHGHWSPFFDVFPCTILVSSASNNGSMGFAPQTTSKMISLIVFFVDLGHLESFVRVILVTTRQELSYTPPTRWWKYTAACATC